MRDLGLQLARAAAARALAAHDQSQTTPEAPEPQPTPRQADPDLAFARHSRSVRQSVELWEKITNNTFARHPQPRHQSWPDCASLEPDADLDDAYDEPQPPPYSELDRGNLYEAVAKLALAHPDHAEIPETLNETIAQTLTAHPDDHVSANFARVCQAYDIEPDRTRLQPHLESQLRPPAHYPKRE